MASKDVQVMEDLYAENDRLAEAIRQDLNARGIYFINVLGAPGVGKTSCLIHLFRGLGGITPYVIEGDIQSDIDTRKLTDLNVDAVQINTNGACHLESVQIQAMLPELKLQPPGILFVENIGNLVCPAEFQIGENIKLLICAVTEGADKPYKYPLAFEKAAAILLNKADLRAYVDFDMDYFTSGIRALNPDAPIFLVSAKNGEGFDEVCKWIKAKL